MHPVSAVQKYGVSFMESIRTLTFPTDLAHAISRVNASSPTSYRLADGGVVPDKNSPVYQAGDTRLKVVNVLDKNMFGDYMKTNEGETTLFNFMRRNSSTMRTIIGG